MALTDLSRCSAAARDRAEPLAGSAPVASRWLLVEHPGPWAKAPLGTPPFLGRVGEEVEATCASFGGRALLVRRQGRRGSEPGARQWFTLDREWPEEVWECTHLGGHRFAGTMLSLPDGACYGYLDAERVVDLVGAHLDGRVAARHLRGVTRWEPAVQAALAAVLVEHGPAGLDDAVPGRVDAGPDGRTRVEVLGSGPVPERVVVEVVAEAVTGFALSCGADPKPAVVHRATVLRD